MKQKKIYKDNVEGYDLTDTVIARIKKITENGESRFILLEYNSDNKSGIQ